MMRGSHHGVAARGIRHSLHSLFFFFSRLLSHSQLEMPVYAPELNRNRGDTEKVRPVVDPLWEYIYSQNTNFLTTEQFADINHLRYVDCGLVYEWIYRSRYVLKYRSHLMDSTQPSSSPKTLQPPI